MDKIVDIQIERLTKLLQDRKIRITLDAKAKKWLAEAGYDPVFGARPLKRVIQRNLQDPLATLILEGKIADGAVVKVSAGKRGLVINGTEFVANTDDFKQLIQGILLEIEKAGDSASADWLKDPNGPIQPKVAALIGNRPESQEPEAALTGSPAPDFTVPLLEGGIFDLSDHLANDGRPVVLNLWASWCIPCRDELPEFVM